MTNLVDVSKSADHGGVGATAEDRGRWKCIWRVDKRLGDWTGEQIDAGVAPEPYESIEIEGNILVTAGITLMLNLLIGAGGTVFSNANANLGVGDSTTAEAIGQTDLQAATNKLRKAMDATYPQVAANVLTVRSTFVGADANWVWNEWAIFNAAAAGTMLNRKVQGLGTKVSTATWTLTGTITIT